MDWDTAQGRRRLRARPEAGPTQTTAPVFRIEDAAGHVLHRVRDARDAQEALALYWRRLGRSIAAGLGRGDLDRSIDLARSRRTPEQTTPGLPLPLPDGEGEAGEAADAQDRARRGAGRRGPGRPRQVFGEPARPQQDLFGGGAPVGEDDDSGLSPAAALDHDGRLAQGPSPGSGPGSGAAPGPEPEPDPDQIFGIDAGGSEDVAERGSAGHDDPGQDEPADDPPAEAAAAPRDQPLAARAVPARQPEVQQLEPSAIMLQRVDPRQFHTRDRTDAYLYHVTNSHDASVALNQGLAVNPLDPVILTERPGVAYWMSVLAEDFDVILDGPADLVVLRMRRRAVEDLLEPDPDASRSAGCACFLLTGGGERSDRRG